MLLDWLVLLIGFTLGWVWGQAYIALKREDKEKGRIIISMPMHPQEAAAVLGLLAKLIEQARR